MRPAISAVGAAALLLFSETSAPQNSTEPVFGTTVVIPYGLRGEIYFLPPQTAKLPGLSALDPVGAIYTSKLNIPPRSFKEGFPGVTDRIEWFAIDYTGRFWIEQPGDYRFALNSDDGSRLYIDGRLTVDDDGIHLPERREAVVALAGGIHRIRVAYFQGPRFQLALQLEIRPPAGQFRIFNTDDFKPPYNSANWKYGRPDELNGDRPSAAASHPPAAQKAFTAGAADLADGKLRQAASSLDRATEIDPGYARAWSTLGLVRYQTGSREDAGVAWRKALALDPGDTKAAVHLASLELEQGRNEDALRITKAAIASGETDNPVLYFCDAVANANLKNSAAAIESARTAIRLDMADEVPRAAELLQNLLAEKR